MSKNFEKVKNYYLLGLWDIGKVYNAVGKWITGEEYEIITRQPYITKEENQNE